MLLPVLPYGATLDFKLFWTIHSLGVVRKKPCPNRRPVELPAGLKFKPSDILPKLGFTAVSWECLILKSPTLFVGRRDFLKVSFISLSGADCIRV